MDNDSHTRQEVCCRLRRDGADHRRGPVRGAAQANAGLDYLSAQGVADVLISDADDHTIVWSLDAGQATMRVTGMMPMSPEFRATGRATDAQDNLVHQPVPTPVVSDAMRFLRMSRTSEALFDAYRYAFLALESLLHDVHPQSARGEAAWFKDALRAADPLVAVAGLAPTGETDAAGWVYANVYSDLRSGLMHAKRDYHLPGDESRRADITQSLESISVYTLELLRKRHGIVRGRGQLSRYGWRHMAETVFGKLRPAVTNDMTTIDLSEPVFAPAGGTAVELPPSPVQHGDSALSCIIGSSDGNDVRALGPLGRIGAVYGSGDAAAFFDVPFGLEVGESVTRFEVLVGMVNPRPGGIRTRFMM